MMREDIPCPKPFSEGCKIVDPNGDTQTCPNLSEQGGCEMMITELVEARQWLEKGLGLSTHQRVSALSAAVEAILDYLEAEG